MYNIGRKLKVIQRFFKWINKKRNSKSWLVLELILWSAFLYVVSIFYMIYSFGWSPTMESEKIPFMGEVTFISDVTPLKQQDYKPIKSHHSPISHTDEGEDKTDISSQVPIIEDDREAVDKKTEDLKKSLASSQATTNTDLATDTKYSDKNNNTGSIPQQLTAPQPLDKHVVYTLVEKMPEFPGGEVAMMQYLSQKIRYPFWAQQYKMQGNVVVQYIVGIDGSITDCRIVQGISMYLDEEVLQAVRTMPKWSPGIKKGKPVRVKCLLPVVFRL